MSGWKIRLKELIHDPTVTRRIYAVTLAAALFILVLIVKGPEEQGVLLTDSRGDVTGIRRHSVNSTERYDVTVTVGRGSEMRQKAVTIDLRGSSGRE